ncbi:hypothetical protein Tco_0738079 [Tanacetum coccineum]
MCGRMFLEESDEVQKYVGGLPDMIHGSVMASNPKTMQDAIEFATKLMDQKIGTIAERQTKNKRNEKKEYAETLPLCNKCKVFAKWLRDAKSQNYRRDAHSDLRLALGVRFWNFKNRKPMNQVIGSEARGMVYALGGGENNQDLDNMEDDINA